MYASAVVNGMNSQPHVKPIVKTNDKRKENCSNQNIDTKILASPN